jgi:hypothetical protein
MRGTPHYLASIGLPPGVPGGTRRHPVGIYRPRGSALRSVRIAGARDSHRCLTGRSSRIRRLGLARDWLTILSVRLLYTRILGVGTCPDQHRCRRQSYYPFHQMPPLFVSIQLWRRRCRHVTSRLMLWRFSRGATAVSACPLRTARNWCHRALHNDRRQPKRHA